MTTIYRIKGPYHTATIQEIDRAGVKGYMLSIHPENDPGFEFARGFFARLDAAKQTAALYVNQKTMFEDM